MLRYHFSSREHHIVILSMLLTDVRRAHCDACKEQEAANRPESDKTERDQEQDKLMSQDIVAVSDMNETQENEQTGNFEK